jgi:hypothetical protein
MTSAENMDQVFLASTSINLNQKLKIFSACRALDTTYSHGSCLAQPNSMKPTMFGLYVVQIYDPDVDRQAR